MKHLFVATLILFGFASCESTEDAQSTSNDITEDTVQNTENQTASEIEPEEDLDPTPSSSMYFTASIYEVPVLMELNFDGDNISGGYWYASQGKRLDLKGTYNDALGYYDVKETYNGKHTGTMHIIPEKGSEIHGKWFEPGEDAYPLSFTGYALDLESDETPELHFTNYVWDHETSVYDSEIDSFIPQPAKDECSVLTFGKTVLFSYSVVGGNAHTGSIDGEATLEDNTFVFNGDDACRMRFTMQGDSITITEESSCRMYGGARASFGGVLKTR